MRAEANRLWRIVEKILEGKVREMGCEGWGMNLKLDYETLGKGKIPQQIQSKPSHRANLGSPLDSGYSATVYK